MTGGFGSAEDDSSPQDAEGEAEEPEAAEETGAAESEEEEAPEPEGAPKGPFGLPRAPASITRFVMIFLGLMAVYAFIDPTVGLGFASVANVLLFPVIGFGGAFPTLTILLAGLLTTTISSVIRDHYTNWVKQARTQVVMRAWQKERFEAMRKGQQTRVQKLMDAQKVFQKDQMDMISTPYKSMAWTLFLFIVLFTWLRLFVDTTLQNLGNQWIAVPWSPHVYLNSVYVLPSWVLLYSLLAIPFGQIITRVLKYVRFRRHLGEMGIPLRPESGGTA